MELVPVQNENLAVLINPTEAERTSLRVSDRRQIKRRTSGKEYCFFHPAASLIRELEQPCSSVFYTALLVTTK